MSLPTFREFTAALHHRGPPYAWQERAADELATSGWWPALRAPTGAGKTSLIDCWLHALALAGPDRLGRRLVWVVDRRAVVDQVFAYAQPIMAAVSASNAEPAVREVGDALRHIGGGASPRAVLWRGGLDDEASIAMSDPLDPASVAVIVSTVDQLGSRLLFRGYGLGIGSRALHAGLLGVDTTVVLDEAHIAEPLAKTLSMIAATQASAPRSPRPPLRVCAVSATRKSQDAFELEERERNEPVIARRISASKRMRLKAGAKLGDVPKLVDALAKDGAKVVGVVLNTVADARAVFDRLDPLPLIDGVLLIGPGRPLDRADLLSSIPDRTRRGERETPFVVVATQTIEVGVDLDFDALVTACAPLDSLVQRFGRLDREGELGTSRGAVLPPPAKGCPVYGKATDHTWKWLGAVAEDGIVDFGVQALSDTIAKHGEPLDAAAVPTIRLLDLHVAALTVTDATEDEGPAIELLLHGDRQATAEVSVAWRLLPAEGAEAPSWQVVRDELDLRPLHARETITLSLAALRRWLAGRDVIALSDVESLENDDPRPATTIRHGIQAWRIPADGPPARLLDPTDLRPSDRVLVSASSGGLDQFGWAPDSRQPVQDLGSLAARGARIVLDPGDDEVADVAEALANGDVPAKKAAKMLARSIERALPDVPERPAFSERVNAVHEALKAGRAALLEDGRVLVVAATARTEHVAGQIVSLDEHQAAVERQAATTASALGIDEDLCVSIRRAARHHDEGKRDSRFQAWLRGGAVAGGALAKGVYPYNPVRVRRLREASGWPSGKRHELVSAVAVALAVPDDSLAPWLIVTHHGRNRPFPAAVADEDAGEVEVWVDGNKGRVLGNDLPSVLSQLRTMADLSREHGPWGLAFLEAVVMTADRAVSAAEAEP